MHDWELVFPGKDENEQRLEYHRACLAGSLELKNIYDVPSRTKGDPQLDASRHFNFYVNNWCSSYRALVHQIADSFGPLGSTVEMSIKIPVAATQEIHNIGRTLECVANLDGPPGSLQANLLLNFSSDSDASKRETADACDEVVRRFAKDRPELAIRCVRVMVDREILRIGFLRSLIDDAVIVLRSRQNESDAAIGKPSRDIILSR